MRQTYLDKMEVSRDENAMITATAGMNLDNNIAEFDGPKVLYVCGSK